MTSRSGSRPRINVVRPNAVAKLLVNPLISIVCRSVMSISRRLDDSAALRFCEAASAAMLRPFRNLRLANMEAVFRTQGWTRTACMELDHACVRFQARMLFDSVRLLHRPFPDVRRTVRLRGEHHLQDALRKGKGAVIVGSHLGNWQLPPIVLSLADYKTATIAYEIPIGALDAQMKGIGERYGIDIAWVGQDSGRAVKRVLGRNGIVHMLFDASMRPNANVWSRFGETAIRADPGAARLALMFDAPVLKIGCVTGADGISTIDIEPDQHVAEIKRTSGDPQRLLDAWFHDLYNDLLTRPHEWWPWSLVRVRGAS